MKGEILDFEEVGGGTVIVYSHRRLTLIVDKYLRFRTRNKILPVSVLFTVISKGIINGETINSMCLELMRHHAKEFGHAHYRNAYRYQDVVVGLRECFLAMNKKYRVKMIHEIEEGWGVFRGNMSGSGKLTHDQDGHYNIPIRQVINIPDIDIASSYTGHL